MKSTKVKQMLANLNDENSNSQLYQTLSEVETNPHLAEVFRRMAEMEARHAEAWSRRLREAGVTVPPFKPSWRARTLSWLARRFGPQLVVPSIISMEQNANRSYHSQDPDSTEIQKMSAEESLHARLLTQVSQTTKQGMEGSTLAQLEGRHRAAGGNALRAAVLGANDGLVSILSLVMGVAGAELSNKAILVSGLAGLLAGAFSMALGEWVSVQSSRELYQHQIEIEAQEIEAAPEEEAEELALIYQARGFEKEQAHQLATRVMADQTSAVETKVREELSVDPKELGGSAWEAAVTSFFLFIIGAIIPVLPFAFLSGMTAIILSILLSGIGLFLIGSAITLFTGRTVLYSGTRMVLFGLSAAAITYLIGKLVGVSIGG